MFRIQGMPQIDPNEEKRKVRENVKNNVFTFLALCAAIRITPFLLAKVAVNE